MTETSREGLLLETFATLADTLVAGFDIVELLQTLVDNCHDLLDASAAGILLADENGDLDVIASTSEASRLVEMMQLNADSGPCIRSFTTGQVISVPDISVSPVEWDSFKQSAREQGFASVAAIPMRLRQTTIGTLNLFGETVGELPAQDLVAAQAFADVATIGILQERAIHESNLVRDQLQRALSSRVVIEQAKGVVAHSRNTSMDEAFQLIRAYARSHQLALSEVAGQLVDRRLTL